MVKKKVRAKGKCQIGTGLGEVIRLGAGDIATIEFKDEAAFGALVNAGVIEEVISANPPKLPPITKISEQVEPEVPKQVEPGASEEVIKSVESEGYFCSVCGRSFSSKRGLAIHEAHHKKEK